MRIISVFNSKCERTIPNKLLNNNGLIIGDNTTARANETCDHNPTRSNKNHNTRNHAQEAIATKPLSIKRQHDLRKQTVIRQICNNSDNVNRTFSQSSHYREKA